MERVAAGEAAERELDPAVVPTADARVVRIATYNVHRCVGFDGKCNAERVAEVLRELDCDVVGLQEVDNNPGEGPPSMQLDYLARATGMTAVPGLRIIRRRGHYGNALLTRDRVLGVRRHDLSFSWREPRGALDVDLDLAGIESRVIVTHLGLTPGERRHQMRQILALVGDTPVDEPLVLLGDINEWLPLGRPLRWLHRLFGRPPHVRSFPSVLPLFALDRIWARPRGSLLEVSAHASASARRASDHLPVVARWAVGSRHASRTPGSRAAPPGSAR